MHQLKLDSAAACAIEPLPSSKVLGATYCAICGVDLRGRFCENQPAVGERKSYKNVLPDDTRWLSDVRVLRGWKTVDVGDLRVERSEVGTYDAFHYFGSNVLLIGARVVHVYTASTVPAHDACTEILVHVTSESERARFWHSISSRRISDNRRVAYCGLASERQGHFWKEVEGEEYMVTNPLKPLSALVETVSRVEIHPTSKPIRMGGPNFFSRLPYELTLYILTFLWTDPTTLLSLRHAVPFVFRLSSSAGNRFWHQVILAEMGDFLPHIRDTLGGFRQADEGRIFAIWRALRTDRSIRNRRRISKLILREGRGNTKPRSNDLSDDEPLSPGLLAELSVH